MGCLCSTPGPQGTPLDTLSDAQRKAADEQRLKLEAERKAEAERKETERKEKEKADKIKADAEAEEKRIALERETARLEAEAKQRREEELFREVKWKEEQLRKREAELAAREAEAAAAAANSPRNRGKSPRSQTRTLASPKAADGKAAAEAVGGAAGGKGAAAGAGAGAGGVALDEVDLEDDSAEYRRQLTAADKEREKVAENPDIKSVRLALSDTLTFWSTKPGGKTANLLVNADATQPASVGWAKEEGNDWATIGLPIGGGVSDLPNVYNAFVCVGKSVRSQRIDLLQKGVPQQVLSHCPKIEVRCYYTASAPNAIKFKVTVELLDAKGERIDSFVSKKTAPFGTGPQRWGEIFHTFKQSAAYDRAPRFVLYKEHGRNKVLRDKATGAVIAVGGAVSPSSPRSPRSGDDDSDIGSPKSPRPTAVGGAGGADANPQAAGLEQPPPHYQVVGSTVMVHLP